MSKQPDPEGDRLKKFEGVTDLTLDPEQPIIIRLDGRSFHSWTSCVERPFDPRLNGLMVDTMLHLASEIGACYCYTQSDEITLVYHPQGKAQPIFGGRVMKLCSLLAGIAAARFNLDLNKWCISTNKIATFDCRAYNVPDRTTAQEVVRWRETDAIRNSTLGRGQEFLSPSAIHGKSPRDVRSWLTENGKSWGLLPPERKFGVAFNKQTVHRAFTTEEVQKLPKMHEARSNPGLIVQRQEYVPVQLPLKWGCVNAVDVIFKGASPIFAHQIDHQTKMERVEE